MVKLYVAIDGGGTKTESILFDSDGKILKKLITDSTNINDIGICQTESELRTIFELLLIDYKGLYTEIFSVYVGLSGGGFRLNKERIREFVVKTLPNAKYIDNGNDVSNVLAAGLMDCLGIILICGTGSVAFAKQHDSITQIGGWGYLLGDEGSGYRIGCDGLNAAYKEIDGRGQVTLITELFENKIGMSLIEALPDIYAKGKRYIAGFSKEVFYAYDLGDEVAVKIVENAAKDLAAHLEAGRKYIYEKPIKTILCGGVIVNQKKFFNLIKLYAGESFHISLLDIPPVIGAGINAFRTGVNISNDEADKLVYNLKNSYFKKEDGDD